MKQFRRKWLSDPTFAFFRKALPPLSTTEQQAMEAGSTWWEADLFSGSPDFQKMLSYPKPELTSEEQSFIDNELETLLGMLDDYTIVKKDRDLPAPVWDYLKENKFFSLIIPKAYGGREFSALANSTIVAKIATRSISSAVTVMVPNSLGPGELLTHYGTEAQKQHWLPKLAVGEEIPCFALTGPEAGSDAGGIPDTGVICEQEFEGSQTLGIRLNWNKRYITLAPVATVLGLAFKLKDPNHLIGDVEDIGISCALIPTSHLGVEVGERHDPIGLAFMNGPTRGKDVFIPIDWLIGGQEYAGKGWRMLVECLSAGRGISLPALGAAIGHLTTRTTGAYALVRKQFGNPIGKFEGVAEPLARIGGFTYLLEAARTFTTTALDSGEKPGVVTAIAKYHMTEIGRQVLNDAMDIHAGRAIQDGPLNYLATHHLGIPIAITVEGANILTRNLMIFGQGATRCHPFVGQEMACVAEAQKEGGFESAANQFDELLVKHIKHASKNALVSLFHALTGSKFASSPVSGQTSDYFKQVARLSRALAISADLAMLSLGGDLKRKEMISARLGDGLSYLYLASAVLKKYHDEGQRVEDWEFVQYGVEYCLTLAARSLRQAYRNFPHVWIGRLLNFIVFPLGNRYRLPSDKLVHGLVKRLMTPSNQRDRLTHLCFWQSSEQDSVGLMELAFNAVHKVSPIEAKITTSIREGKLERKATWAETVIEAEQAEIITTQERQNIEQADRLRSKAIQVDHFSNDLEKVLTSSNEASLSSTKPSEKMNNVA